MSPPDHRRGSPDLRGRLIRQADREGPLSYEALVEAALYGDGGFYAAGGAAGRRGDFLTSPEVGPLFGAVVARALDAWWEEHGRPVPYVVAEAGAGRGALARTVLEAAPRCLEALEYVLVERSAALRARHGDHLELDRPAAPRLRSTPELPERATVVLANELLDNLAFLLLERTPRGWGEVRVAANAGALVEVVVPAGDLSGEASSLAPEAAPGARIPIQRRASDWLRRALSVAPRVVVLDYGSTTPELAARRWREWVRTYRGHQPGTDPLSEVGAQDITCEVALDQLESVRRPARSRSQASFLAAHGIGELVEEGRRTWEERAAIGDLAALRARSRVREAEALMDPAGLGAFRVLEWVER